MNKEAIEKRLLELQKILEQIHANGNATVGAISECKYWLERIELEQLEKKQD